MWSRIEAEQALLGAVLCDPSAQHHVLDLVVPGDMRRPWHAQVLQAMQRVRDRGLVPSAVEVYRELQNDPDLPPSVALDAVPLAGLIEASPRPAHAGHYAAMVVEAGIRQRLHLAGSRIVQAASTGDLEDALTQADQARLDLDSCVARWDAVPRQFRSQAATRPGARVIRRASTGRGTAFPHGDRHSSRNAAVHDHPAQSASQLRAIPRTPGAVQPSPLGQDAASGADRSRLAACVAALRNLIDDPSQLSVVRPWLRPEHFVPVGNQALYALLQDMDAAGQPIDPLTVTWEAGRRGLRADPARLAGGTGPFAVWSSRQVHRLGVLAQIADAGTGIQSDAADPACEPIRLLQSARARLQPFPGPGPPRQHEPQDAANDPDPTQEPTQMGKRSDREATR